MSRRVYLLGVGMAVAAGAFQLTDRLVFPPAVSEANAKRLRLGDGSGWVQHCLGKHPMMEDGGPVFTPGTHIIIYRWFGKDGNAVVAFDRSGRVTAVGWESLDCRRARKDWTVE